MDIIYITKIDKAYNLISQSNKEMISLWFKYVLFSWQWWLGMSLTFVPWISWIFLRKKECTNRLLFSGIIVLLIASWLDLVGILFGTWSYYYKVIPFSPAFIPWDFSLLPVATMLFIQYKPNIRPIYKAIVFSFITSFIAEPLFVLLGLYNRKDWKYIYSFPIMIAIYLIGDWASKIQCFEKV